LNLPTTLEKSTLTGKLRVVSCDKLITNFMMALEQKRSIHEINAIAG
jgi:hypothetical protein